ncbi:MAG: pantoate--beta-alanine ligase, partial [Bacteroidota bacterium]
AGHMALIEAAKQGHDWVVASIFVNPTQFNETADLTAYPRTPEADAALLEQYGCHFLYRPSVVDVYPNGPTESLAGGLDFGTLSQRMEGAHRPGHFSGVAQVVSRLLEIVRPTSLLLGQKDYQQVAIVRSMMQQLELAVKLEVVPTVRETDGLAMSSRNRRLDPEERQAAAVINRHLTAVVAGLEAGWPARSLEEMAIVQLAKHPLLEPEYLEIAHGNTLLPFSDGDAAEEIVVATAVHCGPVRLIDNMVLMRG